jgi:radical SAM superfamily enzyme YgiQ (UPF0313 family)
MGKKLLLSSVCRPFGPQYGDGFGVSYEGTHQIMWAQGAFRTRATTTQWGIDFIAENLRTPTVTLHYPTLRQFIAELRQGYDYVGIAFVSSTLHKMVPMVEAVRRHAPQTRIVLGGYGTALGDTIAPYADHVCRGEGVEFMRRLLDEPVDEPLRQPLITQSSSIFSLPLGGRTGYVFAGLGCPNGCDFCATSHYFGRRHIALLPDGPSILRAIDRLRAQVPDLTSFWINDEDFLLDEARGRGFLEAVRTSGLPPLSLSVFSSVKALSQYTADELVEMGIDWVWVGFEGQRAGFAKMEGRSYADLFADLRRHGISVLASMMMGFDYQTPEIIHEEFETLLALRPAMTQFLIYGPPPGTSLEQRLSAEGRLDAAVMNDHRLHDGFSLMFRHPHIGRDEMSEIQRGLYREEFARLGPSVFRVVEDYLAGYLELRGHAVPRIRAKAQEYGRIAHRALALIQPSRRHVNPATSRWLERLRDSIVAATGPMTLVERAASALVPAAIRYTEFKLRHHLLQQPEFSRRTFRMEPVTDHQFAHPPRVAFEFAGRG